MILDAGPARWLLLLHTALGVAAVAASTHLCVWLTKYLRGASGKRRAVQRFALYAVVLHGLAFLAGNVAYPTYKTHVRAEYLDSPDALTARARAEIESEASIRARATGDTPRAVTDGDVARRTQGLAAGADRIARWFDAKEHWVALGLFLAIAVLALVRAWDPERDGRGPAPFVRLAAYGACATVWYAAIVGVLTASWRAI
ncbi:MAG TPA: hypothetical protein VL463_28440 [Kofleriaceae bacterium]|nr:hypothetical protein [Kofleriaceae bacterium]